MDLQGNPIASIMFNRYRPYVRLFCVCIINNQMRIQFGIFIGWSGFISQKKKKPKKIALSWAVGCACLRLSQLTTKKESIRKWNYEMNAKWNKDNINLLQSSQSLRPKTVYTMLFFSFFFWRRHHHHQRWFWVATFYFGFLN